MPAPPRLMISPRAAAGRAARRARPPSFLLVPCDCGHRRGERCRARGLGARLLPGVSAGTHCPACSRRLCPAVLLRKPPPVPYPSEAEGVRAP